MYIFGKYVSNLAILEIDSFCNQLLNFEKRVKFPLFLASNFSGALWFSSNWTVQTNSLYWRVW